MTGRSIEEIRAAAVEKLEDEHFDGRGCGTTGILGCSRCCGPAPATASEVVDDVFKAADVPGLLDRLDTAERERDLLRDNWIAADEENVRLCAQVEAVEAQVRRQVARDLAAWLDAVFAPPIWHRAVSIADPTFCIMCPHCDGSWEGCQHCDDGFIEDGPVGPQPTEPKEE